MTMTQLLNEMTEKGIEYADIEVYSWTGKKHDFHTDNVKPADYDAMSHIYDYSLMDKEEYSSTILANTGVDFEDIYDADDKVLVVIAESSQELRERLTQVLTETNILAQWNEYAKVPSPLSLQEFVAEILEEVCENGFIEMRAVDSKDGKTHLFNNLGC